MVDPHTGVNGFLTELALLKHTLRLRNNRCVNAKGGVYYVAPLRAPIR